VNGMMGDTVKIKEDWGSYQEKGGKKSFISSNSLLYAAETYFAEGTFLPFVQSSQS